MMRGVVIFIAQLLVVFLMSTDLAQAEKIVVENASNGRQPEAVDAGGEGAQDRRAAGLFREIRCPICVAQSIAESDAESSKSLRIFIRNEIEAGKSDAEIRQILAERYGETILLRPSLKGKTMALWVTPWALLAIALGVWVIMHRGARKRP